MAIQISIIGLGQIGASIGLALRENKGSLLRVGNDIEMSIARRAEKMGAVDRVEINLPNLVKNADLVLLALPVDQVRETLEIIAPDLREGCVVMDTAPAKQTVGQWAAELLPAGRFYVGLAPVINPAYLSDTAVGLDAARADLFKDGLMGIVAPPNTESGALKMASDLAGLVGATPMFSDPLEIDGLMAAAHLLPQLMAAVLVNATAEQPGWRETRKLAGQAYQQGSLPMLHSAKAKSLGAMALNNRQNALRVVTDALLSLDILRSLIEQGDEAALEKWLARSFGAHDHWVKGKLTREWQQEGMPETEMPSTGGMMGRLFGIGGRKPTKK